MKHLRKRKTKLPCPRCALNPTLCICELIPTLNLATRVLLVVHVKELKRTTNSGRLALEALTNSSLKIRGAIGENLDLSEDLTTEYQSLLFYPSEDAIELNRDFTKAIKQPIQLIVPDGNWRQASKVAIRHTELKDVPRVKITTPNTALHHLRKESTEYGMSTLEAIAKALGVIEGPEVEAKLTKLYRAKLEATLKGRGIISD